MVCKWLKEDSVNLSTFPVQGYVWNEERKISKVKLGALTFVVKPLPLEN
jgi:hypothetical protein